jgi:capsular polysaccharide transport system ATP-binding protein
MIRLEKVTKVYRTDSGRHYVFHDLDLEIATGASVGILGSNGAGKTTLLNIIGGIDRPDSGRVVSDGTISWPVGLQGGFQGSMTGRENVKFVCTLYAKKSEIRDKIEYVRDFAEIGEYFDMPVKTYSAGMRSRVAFGLSMAFDFDYYLIDEVTAVGDPHFRKKCEAVLAQKRARSGFVLVSHQMDLIRKTCNVAVVLGSAGAEVFDDVGAAIKRYQENA